MRLYIVRHAYAGEHGDPRYPNDEVRPLTDKGRKRFRQAVKKLAKRGFAPAIVATSPLVRCRQTADVIAERLDLVGRIVELDDLRPGSQLESLVRWTNDHNMDQMAWVGHAPDVQILAGALLGAREEALAFTKGAVAAINFEGFVTPGQGTLAWLATPKSLGC